MSLLVRDILTKVPVLARHTNKGASARQRRHTNKGASARQRRHTNKGVSARHRLTIKGPLLLRDVTVNIKNVIKIYLESPPIIFRKC